jgi:hypothetical protein
MKNVRAFVREDIPQVANLHQQVFGINGKISRQPLSSEILLAYTRYFEKVFFQNPWHDESIPSLVYQEASGKITGFLGVLPRRMVFHGQPVRVALSSQFIVDPDSRSTGAGLRIMQTFFGGAQDLSLTDEANNPSRRLWEGLGGSTALLYSVHWTRLLLPSRYVAARLQRSGLWSPIVSALKPVCHVMDAFLERKLPNRFGQERPQVAAEELTAETLLSGLSQFSGSRMLWPDYDADSLSWLTETIAQKNNLGTLRQQVVYNARREVIGWYLYLLKPGDISSVVQIVAKKNSIMEVLDNLFHGARQSGSVAISGRLDPQFMQALSDKHCFFDCGAPWMLIHSRNPELLRAIHHGDALLSGLEGEMCMRFSANHQ